MRFRALATGVVAAIAIASTAAQAADLGGSLKDEAPAGYGRFSWSGAYAGIHAGFGFGDTKLQENLPNILGFLPPSISSSHDTDGGIAGIHIGLNKQSGNIVFGAELRLSGSGINGSTNDCFGLTTLAGGLATVDCDTSINWAASALAKLGYAHDRVLVYGLAGWTVAGVDHKVTATLNPVLAPLSVASAVNETADGFTFGGGIEFAATSSIVLGIEYTHTNLEAEGSGLLLGGVLTTGSRDIELDEIKGRVSFKFGS